MDANLDAFTVAPYVKVDEELKICREPGRWWPEIDFSTGTIGAELMTLAVLQTLSASRPEGASFLRFARTYSFLICRSSTAMRRLRAAGVQLHILIRVIARDTATFFDNVWLIDQTGVRDRLEIEPEFLGGVCSCVAKWEAQRSA